MFACGRALINLPYHFLLGLDAGVIGHVQRAFTFMEGKGATAPGLHRDVSCVILSAIFVFCLYSVLQFGNSPAIYVYLAFASVAAFVEGRWVRLHARLAKTPSRPDVVQLYNTTALNSRSRMLAFRLISIGYVVVAPFVFSFQGKLDLVSWLLVLLYGFKFYFLCCHPRLNSGRKKPLSQPLGGLV